MNRRNIKFTPWRLKYLQSQSIRGCFVCEALKADPNLENLVLVKSDRSAVMLNRYPYNNGHIMIVPLQHVSRLQMLKPDILMEMTGWMRVAESILEKTYRCDGFNVGMNIGSAAGAGLDSHLHIHMLPRWSGDTNFMSTTADIRIIPEELTVTWNRLAPQFVSRKDNLNS